MDPGVLDYWRGKCTPQSDQLRLVMKRSFAIQIEHVEMRDIEEPTHQGCLQQFLRHEQLQVEAHPVIERFATSSPKATQATKMMSPQDRLANR